MDRSVASEVALVTRILQRLRLTDLTGHVSARLDDPELIAVQPGYGAGAPPPTRVGDSDVLVLDLQGEVVSGRWRPPPEVQLALQIYRGRPDVRAVIYAAPPTVVAMGIAGREILPLTHNEAALVVGGVSWHTPDGLVTTPSRGQAMVQALGGRAVCQLPGLGVVCVAESPLKALRQCDSLEYLGRMNLLTAALTDNPRVLTADEAATIVRQRDAGEKIPSRDLGKYYAAFDDPRAPTRPNWFDSLPPATSDEERIKQRLALACRMLAREETLVAFYEHISHRIPGDDSRFLMTPSKNFPDIRPDDISSVGTSGDCEWLGGPYPPAPFRLYHRDILMARPEVNAIVHTHEMYGRAFAMAGRPLRPVYRNGALLAQQPPLVYQKPSMVLTEEDRRAALETLGGGSILHILSHGTDCLAERLEEATIAAIHREQLYRMDYLAQQFGEPRLLSPATIADIAELGPSAEEWWAYYAADV